MKTALIFLAAVLFGYALGMKRRRSNTRPNPLEVDFMFVVKADNPSVNYSLSYTATDSEGNAVADADLDTEVVSSDTSVVSVSQTDNKSGVVSFGSPGLASLNATVKKKDGTLLGSFGAQFTVTTGDVAAISGGAITFESLSESPVSEQPPTGDGITLAD